MITYFLLALARTLHFGSALLLAGFFYFQLLRKEQENVFSQNLVWIDFLWIIQVLSGALWFCLITQQFTEAWWVPSHLILVATQTHFGQLGCFRAVLALAQGGLLFLLRHKNCFRPLLFPAWTLALLLLLSLAWSGHAASGLQDKSFHLGTDLAHLFAASIWPAGLVSLTVLLGRKTELGSSDLALIQRFSRNSFFAVVLLFLSGFFNAVFFVGSWENLFLTNYGQLLLAKVFFFFLMVGLGAYHRYCLVPGLSIAKNTVKGFRRTLLLENSLALIVLILVALLGLAPPARCPFCP